ncbi:hypothetical protein GCE86_03750 [Micromonospora terminaliae]|uniref:Uncharacterized protein n=1 Tax=Micromonospora terminaliae TaxID=1914461 RepID=A0AAJ2ZLW6_9ACTN|nr:hypothetical protein [Micromonospora terminaliae]NES31568.1 hypothetical protein [Micromonospora terminaliae]QGL46240.1 hypothetical protein GCE86_03750 [Micromonospora terminaliae]
MTGHRMDQETVERLLVGPVTDAQDGPQALVRFLAAVRADPHPQELTGEGAALQAFRQARAGDPVPVAVLPPRPRFRAGLLGAKLALGALLATATGGVALAAVTGNLPGPLNGGGGATLTPSPGAGTDGSATPTAGRNRPGTPSAGPAGLPSSPSGLAGLCTAYRGKKNADRGHALESPPFAALVAAAGGREQVAAYCDALLDGKGKPTGSGPDPTAPRPSEHPTQGTSPKPTARVTGPPPTSPMTGFATTTEPGNRPMQKTTPARPSAR